MWKNRLLYAMCLVISLVFVYFYGGTVPYMLTALVIIAPLLSLAHLLLCAFSLRRAPGKGTRFAVKGQDALFQFELKNRGLLPIPLVTARFIFDGLAFAGTAQADAFLLAPRERHVCTVEAHCLLAGSFPCGLKTLEMHDFLGIFCLRRRARELFTVLVGPRLLQPDALPAVGDAGFNAAAARRRDVTDPLTVTDIRVYAEGDSFRDVHWNLSAKKGSLLVKTHEPVASTPTLLFIDFSPSPEGIHPWVYRDRLLEYAVSLAWYCLHEGLSLRVIFYDDAHLCDYLLAGPADFNALYRRLPAVPLTAGAGAAALVEGCVLHSAPARHLLLVTGNPGGAVEDSLQKALQLGYDVYLYDARQPIPENGDDLAAAAG